MNAATAWETGRLDKRAGSQRLLFGQMHEDPEIETVAFHEKQRIFCIASAGSTARQLALEHDVVACDINPVQLAYAERRLAGAPTVRGDAERLMQFARGFSPIAGWRREIIEDFLALSDPIEQTIFWNQKLDTAVFRAGLDTLLARPLLRLAYSERFLAMLPTNFGAVLRSRLARGIAIHPNATNPFARALFLGELEPGGPLPAHSIQFVLNDAAGYLESCPPASFDGFTLSNILDGAENSYRERLARAVHRAASTDAIVITRSFAEPQNPSTPNHAARDRAMLWGTLEIRPAREM